MLTADPNLALGPEELTPEQVELVRRHLHDLLASHVFSGSKRTQDFLQLIVRHALGGELDQLRERMIGAEMFGRPVGYDTGSDSVVRVKATDLRKRLIQFYAEAKSKPPVRIELPSGSYVPRFHFEAAASSSAIANQSASATSTEPSSLLPEQDSPRFLEAARSKLVSLLATGAWRSPRVLLLTGVACVLLALLGLGIYRMWFAHARSSAEIRSIAILPLANLSGDPAQDYFADGMTEELINDLGQVSTLRVISLTSSMSYKGTKKKLPEIARELAVDGVVEGGVLREGNRVRISVQLIDAKTDRPVLAHTYVRDLTGVLAWQGEVAQAIVEEISLKVTPQEQARLARNRPIDPEAQDLFLKGVLQFNADNCRDAIELFHQAAAKNPLYADPHAALAGCYGRMGESGQMAYKEAFDAQRVEAMRAIELDDSLPEGHAQFANAAMSQNWDWNTAAAEFHRSLQLYPNSTTIHQRYAFYLLRTGHLQEALAEVQRGVDLDPVSPGSFHSEGFIYYFSRQYDQALGLIRTVHDMDIKPPDWNFLLGAVYAEKGMYAKSIAAFLDSGNGPYSLGHLGNVYARAGEADAARKTIVQLQESVRKNGVGRYEIALVYAGLGNKKEALKWLEEAYQAHDVGLVYLKIDPCLDPLRSEPGFADLLRRVGLAN
jgi:TolB-like protein/Flp pilus assembly protein TadD